MNIGTWLACVLYYWVSFYDSTTHISTCSVESHLVKDTGQVSDLVLQVALEVNEVKHQIQRVRANTDKQEPYLEVDPVVEELCCFLLWSCALSKMVVPAEKEGCWWKCDRFLGHLVNWYGDTME